MSTSALANANAVAETLCCGTCTDAFTCVFERENVERADVDERSFNRDALIGAAHATGRMIDPSALPCGALAGEMRARLDG